MNLEDEILKEHSRRNSVRLAAWVGNNPVRFRQLMELFLKGEYRVTQRAAWIVTICADKHPGLIAPYLNKMFGRMLEPGVHVAVKRNVLRILQDAEIPRGMMGKVATICFELLASQHEPVAVKVFAMTVLTNIAQKEPELQNEIRLLIEQQMPWGSAGFRARGKKMLRMLNVPQPG